MKNYEPGFADRLSVAAKARRAELEKARTNAPANDPGFAGRQAARRAAAVERKARNSERKAAKLAEKIRKTKELADEEIARETALKAEQERREADATEQAARDIALAAERKAERDRRYAARKARQR